VERISRSDEDLTGHPEDGLASDFDERRRHAEPMPDAILLVLFEFLQDVGGLAACDMALSEMPLHDRCKFDSRHLAGPESAASK
jgi:hypothetical protein